MWLVSLARLQVTQQLHVTLDIWRLEVDDGLDGAGSVLGPSGVGLNLGKRIILREGARLSSRAAVAPDPWRTHPPAQGPASAPAGPRRFVPFAGVGLPDRCTV